MISESTNRAGTACYDWQVRAMDRAAAAFRRMMADADAHQLARGRHQFTDASGCRTGEWAVIWLPISDAPKDGTQILVPVGKGLFGVVSWWDDCWRENVNMLMLRNEPAVFAHIPAVPA